MVGNTATTMVNLQNNSRNDNGSLAMTMVMVMAMRMTMTTTTMEMRTVTMTMTMNNYVIATTLMTTMVPWRCHVLTCLITGSIA